MLARRAVNPAVRTVQARRDPTASLFRAEPQAADIGRALLTMLRTVVGLKGSGADAVDRFVDRAICATSALRAISGTAPWYPCS